MIDLFIIPKGRTGGSLLATMLNAHSSISMGYELYPDKLINDDGTYFTIQILANLISSSRLYDSDNLNIKSIKYNNIKTFCARSARSGITLGDIVNALNFFNKNTILNNLDSKLDFIDRLLIIQKNKYKKIIVGSKMKVDPYILYKRNPQAVFLMMVRDGRDVLASRLTNGNFNTNPTECAHDWVNSINDFQNFLRIPKVKGVFIKYEDLVLNSKKSLSIICELLNIEYEESMTNYLSRQQPLFMNSYGQLSAAQIQDGLNSNSIGKWKRILSKKDVLTFEMIAREKLIEYRYL